MAMANLLGLLAVLMVIAVPTSHFGVAFAAIIDNGGLVQLGINNAGNLDVPGGTASSASPESGGSTTNVGLRYIPTNGEALAAGCLCEGWGVANADAATGTFAADANQDFGGSHNLDIQSATVSTGSGEAKLLAESTGTRFTSVVTAPAAPTAARVRVTHEYRPSSSSSLYEIVVTIENIGMTSIGDLRYRRVMDWDIPPQTFSEWVRIHVGAGPNLLLATTDGFQSADPQASPGPGVGSPPTTLFPGSADYFGGPSDQGALFDFAFGALAPGGIRTFRLYYGAAADQTAALAAIAAVGAQMYSLGIPRNPDGTADTDGPHVFIFAAKTVNNNPTISDIPDQSTNEDTATAVIPFTVGDVDTGAAALTVSGSSSNTALVPNANIVFGGSGANRTVTLTPAPNQFGSATITVTVTDPDGGSASDSFQLTVNSVNDAPSFTKGPNQTRFEDAGPQTVPFWATNISAGPPDEAGQTLTFLVSNDNNALFSAQPAVSPDGTLTFTSAPNANGVANVTVKLMDNGGTANGGVDTSAPQMFTITVEPVNDAPTFAKGADQTVPEDAGLQTVPGWATAISAGPPDEAGQTLTFLVSNDNNALFSQQPAVSPTGTLTYRPADNANGSAIVTVQLQDNGPTSPGGPGFSPDQNTSPPQTFTITVNAVNDAPVANNDTATVGEDSGPNTIPVLNNDAPGPATATDESSQPLTVTAVTQGTKGAVAISAGGASVIYTPTPNANGTDSFAYTVCDNGTPVECASATVNVTITPDNPTVTSVSLARILQFQTLDVTITGAEFDPGATANFGPATQVQSVIFISQTELIARVFAVAAGPIDFSSDNKVTVINPDGGVFDPIIFTVVRDTDGDGVADNFDFGAPTGLVKDNCPNAFNPTQLDSDNDGDGNDCDDTPQGTLSTTVTPTGTTDTSTPSPAPGEPVFHQVCVTFPGQGTPYFFAPPDDRTVHLEATAGVQTLDRRIFEFVIMVIPDGLEFNDGTSNIERCIVIDLSQQFALPPGTTVQIHTEYQNRAQPQAADQLSAPLLIAEVDLGTKTLMVQSGSPAQTVGGDLTVNPQFWNILWETHPTTATAVFSLSSLTDGATLEQIDLSSLLFEGSLAPASAQLTGGILNLQVNKTDLLRALRKRIVHPFTIDEVERVQLTGRLTDGRILRTGVDITLQNSVEHIDALIAKIEASTISAALKNSTISKLQDARTAILNGQTTRACGKLKDFIREVTGQRGRGIPTAQADEWIADATHIRNIECV